MMSPSRFKALALMAIVFLLGAIVGASLGTTIVSRKFAAPHELAARPGKAKFVDRLNARLHLSQQQTAPTEGHSGRNASTVWRPA